MTETPHTLWWDWPDPKTGRVSRKHRHFNNLRGAQEWLEARRRFNPWIQNELITQATVRSDEQKVTQDKDEADAKNRERLVKLMLRYNITIPAREIDKWRPTVEKTGNIPGVSDGLTCIATNGLLAYFTRPDREPLYGHVHWFHWDTPDISYIPFVNEHGELRYFKSIKDVGAPSAWAKPPPKAKPPSTPKASATGLPKKITLLNATSLVDKLIEKYATK